MSIKVTNNFWQPAMVAVDKLIRSGPPKHVADILQVIKEEQTKGFCSPFQTRAELDDLYGARMLEAP